jgi:protein dithiol oxidoreductase (disulfide-forming)
MSALGRGFAALLLIIPLQACAQAAPEQYQEGKQYQLINPPQPTENSATVEVKEVFWYACPHCFHLEPALEAWLKHKPANVTFIHMPAVLGPTWELLARAYYSAEDLGVVDKIHEPMFNAIHVEHTPMNTDQDVIKFFTAHGVKEDDIRNAMGSFSVETKVRRAKQMGERYGLTGVPAIIVNGKYRTDVGMAGGSDELFKVVDFLIKKESAAAHGK